MLPFLAESTNETLAAVVQLQLHTQHTHTETLANRCTDVRKAKPQNWITIMFICFCIGTTTFDDWRAQHAEDTQGEEEKKASIGV